MKPLLQRILMVEDDLDIQAVASLSLEAVGGYTVELCAGGAQALEIVADFAPDLILLDVMMPLMDGPQVLRHLRENVATRAVPVIFMTAKVQPHEVTSYLEMSALAVISKPFDPMELPATLAQTWEQVWHEKNDVPAPSADLPDAALREAIQ